MDKYLDNHFLTLYLLPFILGSLTVFSFQPFNLTFINFFIFPIFFYLIVYIKKKSKSVYRKKPFKKNLFIFGTFFGFGFFLSGIHWITNSLTFDESFKILIPFGLILIPLFLSLFFSITTVLLGPYLNFNFISILILSAGLGFSDYVRAKIFTGFPWNLWAYSFSWATEILQILNKIGLFGLNLILITLFMSPSFLFFNRSFGKKAICFLYIIIAFLFFYIYGSHSINKNKDFIKSVDENIYIKVISPNFDLKYNLSDYDIDKRLEQLLRYSDVNSNLKTLFVWPEGVFSGYSYIEILRLKEKFSKKFNENHFILFGINRVSEKSNGVYNSLIIVDSRLEILREYRKQKLVPFGEFLPFEKLLSTIGLKKITEGHGSFLRGEKQDNLKLENINLLPLICYEIIFSSLAQKSNQNTNLIINISEDGWFGDSIGPHQHFAKGIFRSIEQNSYLIRSANKGISAIIDNKGKIIKKLNPSETGNIELEVPLIRTNKKNKNDLIFFILLFTYIYLFKFNEKKNVKK